MKRCSGGFAEVSRKVLRALSFNGSRSNRCLAASLRVLLVAFLAVLPAAAQQNTGTISGNVTDTQGALVVNATVSLTALASGATKEIKVNDRGEYLFPNVPAGDYTVTVSAPTFENFAAKSVTVNSTENIRVDAKLKIGPSSDTVTVAEESATVDTRSATVATVIDQTLVQNLPIDGNNVVALAALLPGVTQVSAPTTFTSDTGGPSYVASGSRANQNLFLLDGALWNNVYYNTGLNFPPSEMLTEVSVQLVNYKAQYGRNVGSVFNALTKSGSNTLHGELWEFIQNKSLNASDYLSGVNPKEVSNQFGARLGGPLWRNKAFFLIGYQDLRFVGQVFSNAYPPTLAERGLNQDGVTPRPCISTQWAGKTCASFAADTSTLVNPFYSSTNYVLQAQSSLTATAQTPAGAAQGAQQCLYDLQALALTGSSAPNPEYLPNSELPSECFNPVSLNFTKKYLPVPSHNGVPDTNSLLPIATLADQPRNDQNGLARVDLSLGSHTIDARFYLTNVNDVTQNSISPTSLGVAADDLDYNLAGIYSGNLGDTWVLRSNVLNVFRIDYKRYGYTINPIDSTTLTDLGAVGVQEYGKPTLPRIQVNGRVSVGGQNSTYSYTLNANTEINEAISWTRGNHNYQFGAQYLNLQYVHRFDQTPYLDENANFTTQSIADYTLGVIGSETVGNSTNIGAVDHAYYFYAQDDWRITPKLTLNLGLRYELAFPWFQPDGQSVTFIPGYQSYKFANTPSSLAFQGDPGVPKSIIKTTFDNLAPRVGFAYDVFGNGKTAIRAGFGIFYDALNANTTGIGLPYHYTASYTAPSGSFSQPMVGLTPVPPNYTTPANAIFAFPYTINFADPNVTESYTEAVNLGIQQQLGSGTLEVLYIGKFGRHQIIPVDLNPAIYDCTPGTPYYTADYGTYCGGANATTQVSYQARVTYKGFNYGGQGIVDSNSVGSSSYNGFQAIYTARARKGLTTVLSYTYSRSLDEQSNGSTNTNSIPNPPSVKSQFGPSDFQATHIFNTGWNLALPNLHTGNKIARVIVNDWTWGGIFSAHTGNPFSVYVNGDYLRNGEPNQRAPLAAGLTHYQPLPNRHRQCPYVPVGTNCKVQEWFNLESFDWAPVQPGSTNSLPIYGYTNPSSRNLVYGPAFIDTDMRAGKFFQLPWEGIRMELRADAFNVWNTPNLANPSGTLPGAPPQPSAGNNYQGCNVPLTVACQISYTALGNVPANRGQILQTVGKNGTVGTNGRRVQLSVNLTF